MYNWSWSLSKLVNMKLNGLLKIFTIIKFYFIQIERKAFLNSKLKMCVFYKSFFKNCFTLSKLLGVEEAFSCSTIKSFSDFQRFWSFIHWNTKSKTVQPSKKKKRLWFSSVVGNLPKAFLCEMHFILKG